MCDCNCHKDILEKLYHLGELWAKQGGFIHVRDAGIEILKILDTN